MVPRGHHPQTCPTARRPHPATGRPTSSSSRRMFVTSATAPGRQRQTGPDRGPMSLAPARAGKNAVVKLFVDRSVPRRGRRGAVRVGMGSERPRHRPGGVLLRPHPRRYRLSVSTATSPTARSRPTGRCGSAWRSWAAWRCRARSSPGSPTTAATTPSPTRRATRTRRGCSAPAPPRWPAASGTPTSGGCCAASDQPRPFRPGPAGGSRHRPGQPPVPASGPR